MYVCMYVCMYSTSSSSRRTTSSQSRMDTRTRTGTAARSKAGRQAGNQAAQRLQLDWTGQTEGLREKKRTDKTRNKASKCKERPTACCLNLQQPPRRREYWPLPTPRTLPGLPAQCVLREQPGLPALSQTLAAVHGSRCPGGELFSGHTRRPERESGANLGGLSRCSPP